MLQSPADLISRRSIYDGLALVFWLTASRRWRSGLRMRSEPSLGQECLGRSRGLIVSVKIGNDLVEYVPVDDVFNNRLTVKYTEDIDNRLNSHTVHRLGRDAG